MNKERDTYYFILGLQPGASPTEIKSAFRRLVKIYHADHDKSLDAEMKYKEIREAYGELIKLTVTNKATVSNPYKQTTGAYEEATACSSSEARQNTEYTTWTREEAMSHFYPVEGKITFLWLLTRFVFSLISFHLYILGRFVFGDYFSVAGILMSLAILVSVYFLVFHGVISKGLGTRIAIFCPYFFSMWISISLEVIQTGLTFVAVRAYLVTGVLFCIVITIPTKAFLGRIE